LLNYPLLGPSIQ